MLNVYLCGHGEWISNDLNFNLPRGCSVRFYEHHAKTMLQRAAEQIVGGYYTGPIDQTIPEYRSCPRMTLYPYGAQYRASTINASLRNNDPNTYLHFCDQGYEKLDDIIALFDATQVPGGILFHWCCCRAVTMTGDETHVRTARTANWDLLPDNRTGRAGFNATEILLGQHRYIFRRNQSRNLVPAHDRLT